MKTIFLFAVGFALFAVALSAVARYPPKEAGKPGYCFTDLTGPMKKGETQNIPNQCAEAACQRDTSVALLSCGAIAGPKTDPDYSKPYPKCCPQPK